MTEYYVGRRLSFQGASCTVRYYGPVDGTKGDWLGVEWDESRERGKHDGSHLGKRILMPTQNQIFQHSLSSLRHFIRVFPLTDSHVLHGSGLSDSSTAASFVRPSRSKDKPLSFLDALKEKYVSNEIFGTALSEEQIKISGKTVEEVGFEKIRQQLATLQELRFVILDSLRIAGIENYPGEKDLSVWERIRSQGLSIVELDLGRNLLEEWSDVVGICAALRTESLRVLKLGGNLFRDLDWPNVPEWENPFPNVADLSLSATHFSWLNIGQLLPGFPSLAVLNLSLNGLSTLVVALDTPHLTALDLSSNKITTLWDIAPLVSLPLLEKLSLRHNPISSLVSPLSKAESRQLSFPALKYLDLTSTLLPTLSSLDPITSVFPALTSLLTTNAPLTSLLSSKTLTVARLPTLTELNYSPITTAERQNAELYYLCIIVKQLGAAADSAEELQIVNQHPRWTDLCMIHGEPAIEKRSTEQYAVSTLGARVTEFTFYMTGTELENGRKEAWQYEGDVDQDTDLVSKSKFIPRTVDVYRLKGIVGRLFGIRPMSCKLIWETGEWDPAGGREDEGWSVSEDESDDGDDGPSNGIKVREQNGDRDKTKWERREMELVDGTREVGFWVEAKQARVRVELR